MRETENPYKAIRRTGVAYPGVVPVTSLLRSAHHPHQSSQQRGSVHAPMVQFTCENSPLGIFSGAKRGVTPGNKLGFN